MATKLRWYLGQLDALRGLAILNVMLVHSVYWGPDRVLKLQPALLNQIAYVGQRGVQLFFIVSAFTLFMSYDNRKQEKRPTLNFFIRRIARITPMFYIACGLTYLLWRDASGTAIQRTLAMLYLSFVSPKWFGFGTVGGWSVATEATFYMCLPLLFRAVKTCRQALIAAVISYVVCYRLELYRVAHDFSQLDYWMLKSMAANLPVFLLGAWGYFAWQQYLSPAVMPGRADRRTLSASLLAVVAVLYLALLPSPIYLLFAESIVYLALLLALLIYPWPLLVNRFTVFLGKISFSVYLLHFFVARQIEAWITRSAASHSVLRDVDVQFGCVLTGTVLLTLPLAFATWRWIEMPGIRLGQRLIARLEQQASRSRPTPLVPPLRAAAEMGDSPGAQF